MRRHPVLDSVLMSCPHQAYIRLTGRTEIGPAKRKSILAHDATFRVAHITKAIEEERNTRKINRGARRTRLESKAGHPNSEDV